MAKRTKLEMEADEQPVNDLPASGPPRVRFQKCERCNNLQELPAIFCESCHAPLISISKWFLLLFVSCSFGSFAWFGMHSNEAKFPFPIYAQYALIFIAFSYAVTRRHQVLTIRMLLWTTAILGYGMWFFFLGVAGSVDATTRDIAGLLHLIDEDPAARGGMAALLGFEVITAFVLLWKRFGFAMGYRVFCTLLATALYASKYAFMYASGGTEARVNPKLSDWFLWAPQMQVAEALELAAVYIIRLVVGEMIVTSFLKSFKPATDAYEKIHRGGSVAGASPLVDATARLGSGFIRAALLLQHFARQFGLMLARYAAALGRTLRRVGVDFVVPLLSLVGASVLLAMMAEHSAAYATGSISTRVVHLTPIRHSLATIGAALVLIFFVQLAFLAAVTKFPPRALWRCNALLLLWVAPFAVFLFVFLSLSLAATGLVVARYEGAAFPFRRPGLLTATAGIVLILMLIYAYLVQRRRAPVAETPAEPEPPQLPKT